MPMNRKLYPDNWEAIAAIYSLLCESRSQSVESEMGGCWSRAESLTANIREGKGKSFEFMLFKLV